MEYKLFKQKEKDSTKVTLSKLDEDVKLHEFVQQQKKLNKEQVIMTVKHLFNVAEGLYPKYKIKDLELDLDAKYKHVIGKFVQVANNQGVSYDVLKAVLESVIDDDIDKLKLASMTLESEENIVEIRVNGIVKFKNEPSDKIEELIAKLTEGGFNK